jgi:hypothetical protein
LLSRFFPAMLTAALLAIPSTLAGQSDDGPLSLKRNLRPLEHPYLEASYGVGLPSHKLFSGSFAPVGMLEAKLGYTDIRKWKGVLDLDEKFIYGTYMKSEYSLVKPDPGDVEAEMIRFGTGARGGFGFPVWFLDIVPYSVYTFDLTKTTFLPGSVLAAEDSSILTRIDGAFRFGHSFEAGLQLRIFKSISALASFQGSVVFPRVVFPEWFGSYLLMAGSMVLISNFAEDIVRTSPILGPVLYFILRNGVAFAFYYALREQMNWPFPSETPLAMESVRIGGSISF